MRKWILGMLLLTLSWQAEAQLVRFGIKGGANFSNFSGGVSGIDYKSKTNWHGGAVLQIQVTDSFEIQPELLYSSQGAKIENWDDVNLDYVSVPVLAKFAIMPSRLTLDVGPQFSFLMDDSKGVWEDLTNGDGKTETFDFGVAGGLTLELSHHFWVQGRYVWGLSEVSRDAELKNSTFQLSLVYLF